MKDYYKILGIKKNASEEEIREHWIKLTKNYHPDLSKGNKVDEKIKEINEAYQVLKHSSTRVEYDLKMAYDRRKRKSYVRRLFIPVSILTVFLIIGAVYLKNTTNPTNSTNAINSINSINQSNQTNQRNQIDQNSQKDQINAISPITQSAQKHVDSTNSTTQQRDDAKNSINKIDQIDVPNDLNDINEPNVIRIDATDSINSTNAMTQKLNGPINSKTQLTQRRDDPSTLQRIDASTPLITTEEEVKQFLANYTERYTQKDLDSFISLFSSRAVQNRQDGLGGIRKIYGNFLKQSQKINYNMDDIRIEIYQNAVEVKARYELVQMLKKIGDKKIWRGEIRWTMVKEHGALKILSLDYQHQKSP